MLEIVVVGVGAAITMAEAGIIGRLAHVALIKHAPGVSGVFLGKRQRRAKRVRQNPSR